MKGRPPILTALVILAAALPASAQTYDILIRGGRVLDGSGNPWFVADVGIRSEEIVAVGDLAGATADRVVDAAGKYVTPGFIALHEHIEPDILDGYGTVPNYTTQGFTTAVINTDGMTFGASEPLWPLERERELLEAAGSALNLALLVPHGTIRHLVMGTGPEEVMRYATPDEIDRMRALVRQGMEAGAFGLSTGLEYTPMRYSSEEEVIELAKEVAPYGGHFQAHMRSQGRYPKWQLPSHMDHPTQRHVTWMDAIMEILSIGREAGIPVMIDHIHPKGPREWGMSKVTTQLIDRMWEEGHPVYLNMHSYEGYSAYVTLMPRWALIEGEVPGQSMADDFPPVEYGDMRANLRARLADPATREMIRRDAEYEMIRQGGPENLLITDYPDESLIGKTLAELAGERGETPFETAIWLQMNGFDRPGGVLWMAQAVGTEDIVEWMVQDYTAVTLDRGGDRPDIRDNPAVHPGQYGTSGRLIREHVMERGTITLPHAIRSLTGLAAQILGLSDRGRLAAGMKADVVVFDPETIRTDATYLDPFVFQEGMTHVLVNGAFVVDEGAPTDALPGEVLRRPGSKAAATSEQMPD
ncbi:N-acyl-D-amino-acid deacylase family protein [Candidatus Palauibacter sp.]|uniref:N-acyl-D-amino-acid deacylase family protein n=1 Tax=Candidatus Palauibacter sp. TaxID=3101350 RepID=UPI003B01D2C9